jgi:hypothetical protein
MEGVAEPPERMMVAETTIDMPIINREFRGPRPGYLV